MMDIEELKIGDSVWNDCSPIMEYKIIGKQEFTSSNGKKTTLFVAECLACKHGFDCEILIGLDDSNRYEYKAMLNDDDDDRQYYFHRGNKFKTSLNKAIISKAEKHIMEYEKDINKLKRGVSDKEKRVCDLKIEIETLKKEMQKEAENQEPEEGQG